MKSKLTILLLCLLSIAACTEKTVDFTYSPTEPKAGQSVAFTNNSNFGESWAWDFGDNLTSVGKNPSHTYKKAGTYTIVLMVDSSRNHTYSKTITVYDSIPSFSCSSDTILYFSSVDFKSSAWLPFAKEIEYLWTLDTAAILVSGDVTDEQISVLFTTYERPVTMQLDITADSETTHIQRQFQVYDKPSYSVLSRNTSGDYYQRLYGQYYEWYRPAIYAEMSVLLNQVQDTLGHYGSMTFTRDNLNIPGHPVVEGFMIDQMAGKIYLRDHGLYVANITGEHVVCICDEEVYAVYVDGTDNRLYWSTGQGVWRMPLIQTRNNAYTTIPIRVNSLVGVSKLTIDPSYH